MASQTDSAVRTVSDGVCLMDDADLNRRGICVVVTTSQCLAPTAEDGRYISGFGTRVSREVGSLIIASSINNARGEKDASGTRPS